MKQRYAYLLSALLLVGLLVTPFSAAAQGRVSGPRQANDPDARFAQENDADAAAATFRDRLAARSGPVAVFVELEAAPVVAAVAQAEASGLAANAATAAGQAQLARIEQAQADVVSSISAVAPGATVLYQTQRVINGLAMQVDAGSLAAIMKLPGVARVSRLPVHTLDNASSVPLIGAPEVWRGLPGATGKGIKIGIIDTGIDYHHVDFGGPGGGYELNNTRVITDAPSLQFFGPNAPKVKGGYDFAGDAYDAESDVPAERVPQPDPDPMDCLDPNAETVGHGTHVAGTAAGFGVTSGGARFTGPYSTTLDFSAFRVGPGVAPEADLYALRVFGCSGSTNLTIDAIEWAVDPNKDGNFADRLDVINLSLGSDFGRGGDPDAIAADNAVQAGVSVVFSAGNSGNTFYVSGSPGASSRSIAVASSDDGQDIVDGFRVNSPPAIAGVKPATFSSQYDWANKPVVSGDVVYLPGDGTATGCNVIVNNQPVSPFTPGQLAGKVLLVDWAPQGTSNFPCGSGQRANNAAGAGAVGIIMASGVPFFDGAIAGNATIPAVFTTFTVGQQLKTALGSGAVNVSFDPALASSQSFNNPARVDTLSTFSSRGPRGGDNALKPDIAAPGQSIFSADFNSGNGGKSLNGTSMAAPHVAGAMALLRQLKPTRTAEELKALVMNTAAKDIFGGASGAPPFQAPQRAGTGRIDVPAAAAGEVIAYDTQRPDLVSVSFGAVEVVTTTTLTRTVTVKNFGASAVSYGVGFSAGTSIPGVTYRVTPSSVSVPAGGTATVSVVMRADPAQMRHLPDELVDAQQGTPPRARAYIAEASGTVDFYRTAPTSFFADVQGRNEVPPVLTSTKSAFARFTLDPAANTLAYTIRFDEPITLSSIGSHLHRGAAGENGPILVSLLPEGAYNAGQDYTGTVQLTDEIKALLLAGNVYANFHTAAFPTGEIRGQVLVNSAADLRLGVYSTARAASTMSVTPDTLGTGSAPTRTLELTFNGVGRSTGQALPTDLLSVATLFELQKVSGRNGLADADPATDLSHVGIASTVGATSLVSSTIFFGLATYQNWTTPTNVGFDVYIDTNGSGVSTAANGDITGAEYILYLWNTGSAAGTDANDVFATYLVNLSNNTQRFAGLANVVPPSTADTQPFNSNVIVLPVAAASLGLSDASSKISYRVFSYSYYGGSYVDDSGTLTYDLARPGVTFSSAAAIPGTPAVADLPTTRVTASFNRANFDANRSQGVLVLHHHNVSGTRAEVVAINPKTYLPMIRR
jgi:subtilisin family serine protease